MIMVIEWPVFQTRFLNTGTVYVNEEEDHWVLYSQDGEFAVKSVVEKSDNDEENMMFVERYLASRGNVIKVMAVELPFTEKIVEVESQMLSNEAIREDDELEEELDGDSED